MYLKETACWIQINGSCDKVVFTVNAVLSICFQMYTSLEFEHNLCFKDSSDDDTRIIQDDCNELFNSVETVEEPSPRKRNKLK
jgi:hypothetical protein